MTRLILFTALTSLWVMSLPMTSRPSSAVDLSQQSAKADPVALLLAAAQGKSFDLRSNAAAAMIASVRRLGAPGLDRLIAQAEHGNRLFALEALIDRVAAQKLATSSRLFWYTSLDGARAESSRRGKPILSLRLLGKLDEDQSCANSRFFRTTLYPETIISRHLRERYVLHWQSVRDVPIVTIDLGPGRKLVQPMIGNSVHLVLDSQGHAIEAMPGLVSSERFDEWLRDTDSLWNRLQSTHASQHPAVVAKHHRERAARRRSESSLAIAADQHVRQANPLDPDWIELAKHESVKGEAFVNLQPIAEAAMITAVSKSIIEAPVMRAVAPIQQMIARDTVFNLYVLQTRIDDWFASVTVPISQTKLTNHIYRDVFLMPLDDPWLGLSPSNALVALDNGGRSTSMRMNNEESEMTGMVGTGMGGMGMDDAITMKK